MCSKPKPEKRISNETAAIPAMLRKVTEVNLFMRASLYPGTNSVNALPQRPHGSRLVMFHRAVRIRCLM